MGTRLNLDIDEIRAMLAIDDRHRVTFPEMICQNVHETHISKWIASLLDPGQNRYAVHILNILLKKTDQPECRSDAISVNTESVLGIENRIDIYITTPDSIIGIEVKIDATETGGDQTERYHKEIARRCLRDHKKPVEIYLKPATNNKPHKCPDFKDITFRDILPDLHSLSESLPADREHFILDEFISYLENGSERARFLSLLSKNQSAELNKYHTYFLYKEMTKYLSDHAYTTIKRGNYPKAALGFLQLKREKASEWEKIHFHYEILWTASHYLALNTKVVVAVHLEILSKAKRKELGKFFHSVMDDGTTLFSREIAVDFTSEEKTKETLDRIIQILDSKEVADWGDIADKCVRELFGKPE